MTASKSLPIRPSLASLRKEAKKRARDHSLSLRDAQLAIARQYGFAGWRDLTAEVNKRLGNELEAAAVQARRVIHDNDVEGLKRLLLQHPGLLSWRGGEDKSGLLGFATGAYGDAGDPQREEWFTRASCAELLIDSGALVSPAVTDGLIQSRAKGLLQMFQRRGLLPRTLKFLVALGDLDAVRAALGESASTLTEINEAFTTACRFEHEAIASLLLERAIALDPELGPHVDASIGRPAFVKYFIDYRPGLASEVGPWKAFVIEQVRRAVYSWSGHEASLKDRRGVSDLPAFIRLLDRERWLLGEAFVDVQTRIIERAALHGRSEFITALLEMNPAILRRQPPPRSQAIEFAFTYANTHLIPILTRIWPLPDDLPHAAGMGNLTRVKQWFDDSGAPALGDIKGHYPAAPYMPKDRVEEYERQWGSNLQQRVLDVALAWSVINNHFDVADYLLQHGADINTKWSSHEPASILHELVWHRNYEAMQFLIDRGIDMTIEDYRWKATARGWAYHAAEDPKLARWLEDRQQEREQRQV